MDNQDQKTIKQSGFEEPKLTYITDLSHENYREYEADMIFEINMLRIICGLSFYALARLSNLNIKTISKIFNEEYGYLANPNVNFHLKFYTINKLNEFIKKIIIGGDECNENIH